MGEASKAGTWKIYMPVLYGEALAALEKGSRPEEARPEVAAIITTVDLRSGIMGGEKLEDLGRELKVEFWKAKRNSLFEEVRRLEQSGEAGEAVAQAVEKFKEASLELQHLFE